MLNEIWITVFTLIKSIVGDVDVKNKGTLQKQIDDCFQSASDGKSAIASAITGKGVSTDAEATVAQMAANIGSIKTNPRLQAKNAALSTAAQAIKPDSGYDGLSQVAIPAVTGNAAQGDVLSGRTFNSATAGIAKAGTLADKTGAADYSATASLDNTNGRIKLQVPAVGKYGTGNYLYAAFATIASLIGLTASKLVKGYTILGITGNSANVDTSAGNAAASQILSGKKAYVGGNLVTGSMSDKGGTTVDAGAVTQDSSYTYFGVPSSGYYSTGSKLRALNSNLGSKSFKVAKHSSGRYSSNATLTVQYTADESCDLIAIAERCGPYIRSYSCKVTRNGAAIDKLYSDNGDTIRTITTIYAPIHVNAGDVVKISINCDTADTSRFFYMSGTIIKV